MTSGQSRSAGRSSGSAPPDAEALIAAARSARGRAYAPYSRFLVGAALLGRSGRVHEGVNVENVTFGLSICAERAALFSAVSAGERTFDALAVATDTDEPTPPCGSCRQALLEFAPDLAVFLAGRGPSYESHTLDRLLPRPFASLPAIP